MRSGTVLVVEDEAEFGTPLRDNYEHLVRRAHTVAERLYV